MMKHFFNLIILITLLLCVNESYAYSAKSNSEYFTLYGLTCNKEIKNSGGTTLKYNYPNTHLYWIKVYDVDNYGNETLYTTVNVNEFNNTTKHYAVPTPYITTIRPLVVVIRHSSPGGVRTDRIQLNRSSIFNFNINVAIGNQSELNNSLTYKNDRVEVKYGYIDPALLSSITLKSLSPYLKVVGNQLELLTDYNSSIANSNLEFETIATNVCGQTFKKKHSLKARPFFVAPSNFRVSHVNGKINVYFEENNTDRSGTVALYRTVYGYPSLLGTYSISSITDTKIYTNHSYHSMYLYYLVYKDYKGNTYQTPTYSSSGSSYRMQSTETIALKDDIEIKSYPNPTSDFINIVYDSNEESSVKIYNINGLEMVSTSFKNAIKVDTKNFDKGIYFISINGQTTKFLKQ